MSLSSVSDPPLPTDFKEVTSSTDTDVKLTERLPRVLVYSDDRDSLSESAAEQPRRATGEGLSTFMSSWKMNDFFFLIVNENVSPGSAAWFSVLPNDVKRRFIVPVAEWMNQSEAHAAFSFPAGYGGDSHAHHNVAGRQPAWRADLRQLPGLVFLSLAWFWLLLPTLNPWYWIVGDAVAAICSIAQLVVDVRLCRSSITRDSGSRTPGAHN